MNGLLKRSYSILLTVTFIILCSLQGYAASDRAAAPTVQLTAAAGDYSAYLTWNTDGNGSDITRFEISYAASAEPDAEIDTVTLGPDVKSHTLSGLSGGVGYIIKLTAVNGIGSTSVTSTVTPNDPDLATVTAVKNEIESSEIAVHMDLANSISSVRKYLISYFGRYSEYGVRVVDITVTELVPARAVSTNSPDAAPGSFTYIAELAKGDVRVTTKKLSARIDNSSSIVYLLAEKFSVMVNEPLKVTAYSVDIHSYTYEWYRADSETDEGTLISGVNGNVYEIPTDKAGEYFLYCVSGGVSSERVKFTISEPFSAVSDIELFTDIVDVGENSILHSSVVPLNATNTAVSWEIENDGGCDASITGRTFRAEKTGTVTVKATVKDGLSDGDFEKIFYITVKEKSTETEPEQTTAEDEQKGLYTYELDCAKISGIEAISVTAEYGEIQITPVTDQTVKKLLELSNIPQNGTDVIAAVKFVYSEGAIAHSTVMKLKGYDGETVKILTQNGNGGRTITEQKPDNGYITGNTVSPDIVILIRQASDAPVKTVPYMIILISVPVLLALIFISGTAIGSKLKKNRKG